MNLQRFEDAFQDGPRLFGHRLDNTIFSGPQHLAEAPHPSQVGIKPREQFSRLPGEFLRHFVGRILLSPNQGLGAMSPAVLLPKPGSAFELTRLNQAFDPRIGVSSGMLFGLSAKAQTQDSRFGGHGLMAGFEAGHFSSVLISAGSVAASHELLMSGDKATHRLLNKGVPETMGTAGILPLEYQTRLIAADRLPQVPLFWHPSLETAQGIALAEYPNSVQIMLGAGISALGKDGVNRVHRLVDAAIANGGN